LAGSFALSSNNQNSWGITTNRDAGGNGGGIANEGGSTLTVSNSVLSRSREATVPASKP